MSRSVHDWLPVEVAAGEPVRAALDAAAQQWSTAWLGRRRVGVSALTHVSAKAAARGEGADWRTCGGALAIDHGRRNLARLTDWALDASVDQLAPNDLDRRLIAAFERRLLDDLLERLELALGLEAAPPTPPRATGNPFGPLGGVAATLADAQGAQLTAVAVPWRAVLPFVRRMLPQRQTGHPRPVLLQHALAGDAVTIEAILGRVDLTVSELRGLSPGDVLVLDTPLDRTAEIRVAGTQGAIARASLGEADGRIALTLEG